MAKKAGMASDPLAAALDLHRRHMASPKTATPGSQRKLMDMLVEIEKSEKAEGRNMAKKSKPEKGAKGGMDRHMEDAPPKASNDMSCPCGCKDQKGCKCPGCPMSGKK